MFVKEVWNASLPTHIRDPAGIPLGVLAAGTQRYLVNNPTPPAKVQGPLSALHLALTACEWTFKDALNWFDRSHNLIHLPTFCPRRIIGLFRRDYAATICRRGITKSFSHLLPLHAKDLCSKGAFFEPLRTLYNKLDPVRSSALLALVSNGVFTNTDLFNKGYDISTTCQDCLAAQDTIFHRCFSCVKIETRARLAIGSPLYDEIIAEGDSSCKGTRCLFPAPVVDAKASVQTRFECVGLSKDEMLCPENGKIFGDGSCLNPSSSSLARSGWAVVQVDPDGYLTRAMYGCVPAGLAQTSLAGEHMAFWVAFENTRNCIYAGDCQDIISAFQAGWPALLKGNNPHADLCKSVLGRTGWVDQHIVAACKVKAHRSLADTISLGEPVVNYWGNFHADLLARKGAELHPSTRADETSMKALNKTVTDLALHMVDCLACLRNDRLLRNGKIPMLPIGVRNKFSSSGRTNHRFTWNGKYWLCSCCFLRTSDPGNLPPQRTLCSGFSLLEGLFLNPKGHKLWHGTVGGTDPVVYCSKCWGFVTCCARKLGSSCRGLKGPPYPCARSFIIRGLHPISRLRLTKPALLHGSFQ